MSFHIQLRSWNSNIVNDEPVEGEPFWDPIAKRFGVWTNSDGGTMRWLPAMELASYVFQQGMTVSGVDSGGDENAIQFDWSTPGELKIIDTANANKVLATFTTANQVFDNASTALDGTPAGFTNRLVNAGLSEERSLLPVASIDTSAVEFSAVDLIAPNWVVWKKAGSGGDAVFSLSTDVPANIGCNKSLKITATGAPTNLGSRVYAMDYRSFVGKVVTAAVYIKGPNGADAQCRLVSDVGGVVDSLDFTADGTWQRKEVTFTPTDDGSSYIGFDVIRNPSNNTPDSGDWYVAAPMLVEGVTMRPFESRVSPMDRAALCAMYAERYVNYDGLNGISKNLTELNMASRANGHIRVLYQADDLSAFTFPSIGPGYIQYTRTAPAAAVALKLTAFYAPSDADLD